MLKVIEGRGRNGKAPSIFTAIPPPLMQADSIGANQTTINSVYPKLWRLPRPPSAGTRALTRPAGCR